jgi:hypothetical protein
VSTPGIPGPEVSAPMYGPEVSSQLISKPGPEMSIQEASSREVSKV